jgi:hypothetical protein
MKNSDKVRENTRKKKKKKEKRKKKKKRSLHVLLDAWQ